MDSTNRPLSADELIREACKASAAARELAESSAALIAQTKAAVARALAAVERYNQPQDEQDNDSDQNEEGERAGAS